MSRLTSKIKRAQIIGTDVVVAFVIFSFGLVIFSLFLINFQTDAPGEFEALFYEGGLIAGSLLSEGSPENWESVGVEKIGILSDEKVNETKLENFYALSQSDYLRTKILFNINYDYYVTFGEEITINGVVVEGIGKPGVDLESIDSENLVKINRVTIYNEKPVELYVYAWN